MSHFYVLLALGCVHNLGGKKHLKEPDRVNLVEKIKVVFELFLARGKSSLCLYYVCFVDPLDHTRR